MPVESAQPTFCTARCLNLVTGNLPWNPTAWNFLRRETCRIIQFSSPPLCDFSKYIKWDGGSYILFCSSPRINFVQKFCAPCIRLVQLYFPLATPFSRPPRCFCLFSALCTRPVCSILFTATKLEQLHSTQLYIVQKLAWLFDAPGWKSCIILLQKCVLVYLSLS